MNSTALKTWIEKNINLAFLGVLQILILVFLQYNCHVHKISSIFGLKLFLYQFFAWFLAGYAVINLLNLNVKRITEVLALSYGIGGIFSLLLYFAFVVPGAKAVLPYFTIAEAICICIYLYHKKINIEKYETDRFGIILCIAILLVYYVFALLSSSP